MQIISPPTEILGQAIANILHKHHEIGGEKFTQLVQNYRKKVKVTTDLYSVIVVFANGAINIYYAQQGEKGDFEIAFAMETLFKIAEGRTSAIAAFLSGKIKVKPLSRILSVLKLYKILFPPITAAKADLRVNLIE